MDSITILIIALGLSIDAFAVAISSGLLIKKLTFSQALKIALFFGIFQILMPVIGWSIGFTLTDLIAVVNHWIVFVILTWCGGKMIYQSLHYPASKQKFNPLDNTTVLTLSLATSIDGLAVSMSLALMKSDFSLVVIAMGGFTFILSLIGVFLGNKFGRLFRENIEIFGGFVLITVGTEILVKSLIS